VTDREDSLDALPQNLLLKQAFEYSSRSWVASSLTPSLSIPRHRKFASWAQLVKTKKTLADWTIKDVEGDLMNSAKLRCVSLCGAAYLAVGYGPATPQKVNLTALGLVHVHNAMEPRVSGEFIVTFTNNLGLSSVDAHNVRARQLEAQGFKVLKHFRSSASVLVKVPEPEGSSGFISAMARLQSDPQVAGVEANVKLGLLTTPNDDRFSQQYALQNLGQTGGTTGADISAIEGWQVTTGSRDVVVAVIDTGIDHSHPDLIDNMWLNPGEVGQDANGQDKSTNGLDDDGNGYIDDLRGWDFVNDDNDPMDDQGHGTHTAGTIGASGNNTLGVTGVAWQVGLVGLKFLGADGSGTLDDAVEAIEYATRLGVKLSSNSWGGGGYSAAMAAAIREANDRGILFVAAAGNESNNNDQAPSYPASYAFDNVISVAATDHADRLAFFSNFGKSSVHLAAPGVNVLSTMPGGKYKELSGTSMACPHVSGAAALIWSAFPELSGALVKARLLANVTPIATLDGRTTTAGRLSLPRSLELDSNTPGQPGPASVLSAGLFSAQIDWSTTGDDGLEGRAAAYEIWFVQRTEESGAPSFEASSESRRLGVVRDRADAERLSFVIDNVSESFRGYVAIRAVDNVGNVGPFSEPTFVRLADRVVLSSVNASSAEGVVFEGPWGVETTDAQGMVFSDSPGGDYQEAADHSLVLPAVTVDLGKESYLTFFETYVLEPRFDFAIVEYRPEGQEGWTLLSKVSGSTPWSQRVIKLPATDQGPATLQFRFRIQSDRSVSFDGWLLNDLNVIQVP
jgi:subtilisin family serine protease